MSKKALLFGFTRDTLSLLLTSQLGVGATSTATIYNQPTLRIKMGANRIVGDTMQLVVNGTTNGSAVIQSTDLANGFIDIKVGGVLAAGTYSVQSRVVRTGVLNNPTNITIFGAPLDALSTNLYAAHGLQRLLTSYVGPLCQVIRSVDNATLDIFPNIDGYANVAAAYSFGRLSSATTLSVTKLYDQTGNGRDAVATSAAQRPSLYNRAIDNDPGFPSGATFASWGWRGQLRFDTTNVGAAVQHQLTVSNMGTFAQSVGAVTLIASACMQYFGLDAGIPKALINVSDNATGRRASIISLAAGPPDLVEAGGKRLDADTQVNTADITAIEDNPLASQPRSTGMYPWVARFDYTNAVLTFNAYNTQTVKTSFQTAGSTSNTASATVTIGGASDGGLYKGELMSAAFFQRKLTDLETTLLTTTSQFNYLNISQNFVVRAGNTLGIEAFRTAITQEIFKGPNYSGLIPSTGFDTSTLNTTDPLSTLSPPASPSNLKQFDLHTILIKDDTNTTIRTVQVGVWFPTNVTANGKYIIYICGTEDYPPTHNFRDAEFVQTMVQAGYTMTYINGYYPFTFVADATSTLNPNRYLIEGIIRTINALAPLFPTKPPLLCGFSAGASPACLAAAVDTRVAATVVHDGVYPVWTYGSGQGYWNMLIGLTNLAATGGCDWNDLWLLDTIASGGTVKRNLQLTYVDTQLANQQGNQNYFGNTSAVIALYGGTFAFTFDTVDTNHEWTPATVALVQSTFAPY